MPNLETIDLIMGENCYFLSISCFCDLDLDHYEVCLRFIVIIPSATFY